MGLVNIDVKFDGPAPKPEQVAAKLMEIVGLPVTIKNPGFAEKEGLYDWYIYLAFHCFAEDKVTLFTYRAGAVKEHLDKTGMNIPWYTKGVTGANEPSGTQTVYIEGYLGQEPTILFATSLALEALGGCLPEIMSDEMRREYGGTISAAELDRHRKTHRQGAYSLAAGLVLLPILIPLWVLSFAWFFVRLPWRLRKAYRLGKTYAERR